MFCEKCGAQIPSDSMFCEKCGRPVTPEQPMQPQKVYCQKCGKELETGARFCDKCGAQVGKTADTRQLEPNLLGVLLKQFFVKPAETIKLASDKEGMGAGIILFLIKDLIIAILAVLTMNKLMSYLGYFSYLVSDGDTFVISVKVFFAAVVLDALWMGALLAAGKLFGGDITVPRLIGAAGTASIFLSCAIIVIAIFAGLFPTAVMCPMFLMMAVLAVTGWIILDQVMGVDNDKKMYAVPLMMFVYALVLYFIMYMIVNSATGGMDYL